MTGFDNFLIKFALNVETQNRALITLNFAE